MKKIVLLLCLLSSLFSKDFQSIKLVEFAQLVSNATGKNIVISDTVQKDFSIYLPDVNLLNSKVSIKLLFELLDVNQLSHRDFDNIVLIYKELPKPELPKPEEPKPILNPYIVKYQFLNIKELQSFLSSMYSDVKFSFLKNRVFFTTTAENYKLINEYIELLDKSYLQANLYFNVISTSNNMSDDIGLDLSYTSEISQNEVGKYLNILTSSVKFESTLSDPTRFFTIINLLNKKGHTKFLQNPSVSVRDGGSSVLDSTTSIPVLQATTSSSSTLATTQNSYKYEDVGLKLNITEVFITNDVFTFNLDIELEAILDKSTTPTISKKKLKTTISLKNNEPFVIAGINSTDDVESVSNIPFIEYIPVLNKLTEHKTTSNKNETFTIILNTDFFKKISADSQSFNEALAPKLKD
ncbi:MAG: hypothetical protein PHN38_04180 [Sulfurospirillaceae bacterium]|nr:hypothetical protein [Sulfurospirillaceae bacterium]